MANDTNKQIGLVMLMDDEDPKIIAAQLDVAVGTVLRWKNELAKAKDEDKVNDLIKLDNLALDMLAKQANGLNVPDELQTPLSESIDNVTKGVTGLQRLETDLQSTANYLNTRIRSMGSTANTVGEINELTEALCKLQNAFFAKGTNVQILNQVGGNESYGQFLGDAPGS